MISESVYDRKTTFPKSVQPGIPRLKPPKLGWSTYKLSDLVEPVQRSIKLNDNETYDLVTVKRSRGGVESRGRLLGSQISVKTQFKLQADDFLISKRQIVHGACGIVPDTQHGAIVSNEYSILRCKPVLNLNFLNYLSHTIYFQQICFHSSIGVHIEKMIFKLDEWLKWPINIPSLPEQQKIADFLSSVDAKIDAVKRKLDALERYKKGLMQQIFSQKIRFKQDDGSDFPEWEEKRLGDIAFKVSSTLTETALDLQSGIYPVYGASGLITYIDTFLSNTEYIGIVKDGAGAGRLTYCPAFSSVIGTMDIIKSKNNYLINYIYYYLQLIDFKKYITGSTIPHIYFRDYGKKVLNIPSLPEQQKIADFLSATDAKIDAIKAQVEKLEAYKKGLLQQMFV